MTVSVQTPFNSSTGNGVTTVFPYTFKIISSDDLKVTVNGVLQTIGTNYTVSGVGGASGNVTFLSPPANGAIVVRYSDTLMKRDTDYQQNGDFLESVVDADFDRLWLGLRDTTSKADRGLRAPAGEVFADLPVAATRASKLLGFDGDGDPVLYVEADVGTTVVTAYGATLLTAGTAADARTVLEAAPLASPTFTGNPAAPTPAQGDADTSIATTAHVAGAIQPTFSYIFNGDGRLWGSGFSASPSGWGLTGAGATVARNTTAGQFRWGAAGVNVTRSGTDCALSQTVTNNPAFGPAASWAGKTITVGAWVYATVAGRARVTISDSVTTVNSAFHPGDSTLRFLTATMTVAGGVTAISMGCSVSAGNTTATFSGMTLALGSYLQDSVASYGARKCVIPFHVQAGATVSAGTTGFYHSAGADTAESNANVGVPFRGVARNLYCNSGGSPGIGQTFIFTMRRAGADTILTATISGAATSANDTTNQAEYTAGQNMCLRVVSSGGASTVGGLGAYIEYEEVPV